METAAEMQSRVEEQYPVTLTVSDRGYGLIVHAIVVHEGERGGGVGTRVMREVMDWALCARTPVALTPSPDFGGKVTKLRRWYRSLGFRFNRGRNKDFMFREAMIWRPSWDR